MTRVFLLLVALLAAACGRTPPPFPGKPERTEAWDPELVAQVGGCPVQDTGRVKPLATLAAFALYEIHGRRDLQYTWTDAGGEVHKVTLTPIEWLLDVWCFPNQAVDFPLFRIENVAVMDAIGLRHGGQRFDFEYLSYRRLSEVRDRLLGAAQPAFQKKQRKEKLSPVEEHVLQLWRHLNHYDGLHHHLAALRSTFPVEGAELRALFGGKERVSLPEILERGPAFLAFLRQHVDQPETPAAGNAFALAQVLTAEANRDDDPALFPPPQAVAEEPRWSTLGRVVDQGLRQSAGPQQAMLVALHDAVTAGDAGARKAAWGRYVAAVSQGADRRGELAGSVLEAKYHRWSLHFQALIWFGLGFLLVAVSWLLPRKKLFWWLAMLGTAVPLVLLGTDITLRAVIAGRPPISNLYDTFLWIPAVGVLAALVTEAINRKRLALSVAPVVGGVGILLARLFELSDGQDTLREIPAVLRSNFWLATHVTSINIGYGAGMLAAFLGSLWLMLRVFQVRLGDAPFYKSLARMTYGVTCFGLFFAVVGTILGGVWAEDSWGRFWGWDPKENGALLICLAQISLLHARMSGLVRDFGFQVWAGCVGIVIAFSWFHTNLLEVGLHSYGFSGGLARGLYTYYAVQGSILVIGVAGRLFGFDRAPATVAGGAGAAEGLDADDAPAS